MVVLRYVAYMQRHAAKVLGNLLQTCRALRRSCKLGARTYMGGEPVAFASRKAMAMSSQLRWASTYSSTAGGIVSVYVVSQSRCNNAPYETQQLLLRSGNQRMHESQLMHVVIVSRRAATAATLVMPASPEQVARMATFVSTML